MKRMLILFLMLMVVAAGCAKTNVDSGTDTGTQPTQIVNENEGRVVFAVTDAAADMGSVTKVMVTIDEVEVHGSTGTWVTVSETPMTFDLLELDAQNKLELLADVMLEEEAYNQIRLEISEVTVVDSEGEHDAKLPSGELRINTDFVVDSNTTIATTFDFQAGDSLHVTGNGQYIMAPVLDVSTMEDAQVQVETDFVRISGGRAKPMVRVGMDINGTVGVGLNIPRDLNISIGSDGMLKAGKNSEKSGIGVNASAKAGVSIG